MGAVTKVQKIINGKIVDITNVEDMNREIQEASRERFTLACEAPIQRSSIKNKAGTCAETDYARQLLTKEVDIPQDTDEATNHLLEEMADLWERMCDKHIRPAITERDYKGHWRRMKESTSSALSRIHMGHWKASYNALN